MEATIVNGDHHKIFLKQLNSLVKHKAGVATRWYNLGVELLDSNTAVLDVIKTSHQRDDDRCSEMLKTWLEMKPDANWSQLGIALNNIGLNIAVDTLRDTALQKEVVDTQVLTIDMLKTADQASVEFGVLLREILKELKKNESENLELLKIMSSALTVKDKSGVRVFSDSELEGINACNNLNTLLVVKLRHCYRWDDHSMLTVLMSSLNAEKCSELLETFQIKLDVKMKLQEIYKHCLKEKSEFPEGYHKMVAIVDKKAFSSITKEEYDELKQFISQHCGVEAYVMSPFSKASPFSSVVFEWFIPVNTVSHMINTAEKTIKELLAESVVYLKISKTVVIDHRKNKEEHHRLLDAARTGDITTIEGLVNTRYIDVNTTRSTVFNLTALHVATRNGQVEVIEALMRLGADVNALDKFSRTALHHAVKKCQLEVVETLIRFGADANALNQDNRTPLEIALQDGHSDIVQLLWNKARVDDIDSECVKYNVVGGKMTRGLMVVSTLSQLYGDRTLSDREKHLAFTLGWCIEILQAASLVADDIVDESVMRRNKMCWYKKDHIRMIAVNDSFWLISSAYVLLNSEFRHHPCYIELIELFHMVVEYTEIGEIMDVLFSQKITDLSQFTEERLKSIVKYKTGYFSFYFPVAVAFCMAGINNKAANEGAMSILLEIGEYYQNQDDFIDCFGDPDIVGKVGTDIQGNKCTWLIVQALKRANDEQRAILEANYGRSDEGCVEKVKEVYESLNLRHLYSEYEELSYRSISKLIDKHSHVLPAPIFLELRDRIYKREK